MVSLGPHHLPPIISFSFFEPIEHDIILLRSFNVSRGASLHIGHNILLLKVGRSYNIKRGKKKKIVVNFYRTSIIYRFGVLRYIIIDNGKEFYNIAMNKLFAQFGF